MSQGLFRVRGIFSIAVRTWHGASRDKGICGVDCRRANRGAVEGLFAALCGDARVAAMAAPGATIRRVRDQGSCAGAEESSVISVSAWWSPEVFDMETRRARRAGSAYVIALHLLGCRRIAGLSHVSRGLGSPVFDMEPA